MNQRTDLKKVKIIVYFVYLWRTLPPEQLYNSLMEINKYYEFI